MKKFNWAVTAGGFGRSGRSHRLQIEEAEDKMSEAIELLKQARHSGSPEVNIAEIDEILQEISSSLDKIRKLRNDMRQS